MTYTLIAHQELTSTQTSVVFSSIPQTFTDLYVMVSSRNATVTEHLLIGLNGSTANFSGLFLSGSTNVESGGYGRYLGNQMPSNAPANTFSNVGIYIANYRTSAAKSISSDAIGFRADRNSYTAITAANLWNSSAAITSIELTNESSSNLAIGSSYSLYGITAGSSGGVTVS
jgi:hypothetical protein